MSAKNRQSGLRWGETIRSSPTQFHYAVQNLEFTFTKKYQFFKSTLLFLDFSLTVKAATLIFISGCGSAISSAKEGKSGFIYNLVKS